jgi:hypothetical protein
LRIERKWRVSIYASNIWLSRPLRYSNPEKWDTWGKIQAQVLSRFRQRWPESHIYIRLYTCIPEYFTDVLIPGHFEKIAEVRKNHIFILPDCQDQHVLETIFTPAGHDPFARTIFVLDQKPANWKETITRLFEIAVKLSDRQPAANFEGELSTCRLLCYSMDEDLVIAKVDLPENIVISILEDIARENDLDLVIERK